METEGKQQKFSLVHHFREQPFISATALAALIHSTWALATTFGGAQPPLTDDPATWLRFAFWGLPALLVAFAFDIGQVVTSAEIRHGKRNRSKYATFFVLALATYYLQFTYMVHHIPLLTLGEGVAQSVYWIVMPARDLAIFIIPALLPASTLLYTFSQQDDAQVRTIAATTVGIKPTVAIAVSEPDQPALPDAQPTPVTVPQLPQPLDASADYKALFTRLPKDMRECNLCHKQFRRAGMKAHYEMHRKRGDLSVITEEQTQS